MLISVWPKNCPYGSPVTQTTGIQVSQLLKKSELARKLKVSVNTLNKMVEAGTVPAPRQLTERTLRWVESEIDQWLKDGCPAAQPAEAN